MNREEEKNMKSKKYSTKLAILLLACFLLAFSFEDIKLGSLMQKKKHHEVIKILQPRLDETKQLSSWHLFFLASAYYEVRDYDKVISITDLLQKQVDLGDHSYYGGDITVYPQILRGSVFLDQGIPLKAVEEGNLAYKLLHSEGRNSQNFYKSQVISICDFLGVALELSGNKEDAQKMIDVLQSVNTSGMILGPEKYSALARIYMAKKEYGKALAAIKDPQADVIGLVKAFYDQTFQEIPKLYILSKSLYETGNLQEAKEGYDQLLGHPQIEQIGGIYWIVLSDRAKIALAEGQKVLRKTCSKKQLM
jgi:tetratricopeptide (TPR) repeat protein